MSSPHPDAVARRLYRQMRQTCQTHALLELGDRILVGVSGGKDSYTLLDLLGRLVSRLNFPVSYVAVHLDQQQPGYDGAPLRDWLAESGHPYEILSEDTYSTVVAKVPEGATYCALCSRLRRGILYTAAERLGCNKIALGHHRDDTLQTFLLNLFFAGKLQAMPARYRTDDARFEVIRPLIDIEESLIVRYAQAAQFPILPCNLCGSQENLQRQEMAKLIDRMAEKNPNVRAVMAAALGNVRPTHLLDPAVLAAFTAYAPAIPSAPPPAGGPRRLPLITG